MQYREKDMVLYIGRDFPHGLAEVDYIPPSGEIAFVKIHNLNTVVNWPVFPYELAPLESMK